MKRWVDFWMALLLLILATPIILFCSSIFYGLYREKPIYVSQRAGKNGLPFAIYKLKSMRTRLDENGKLLPDAERLTKYGNLLRKLSLDELPQLLNIVKGEMSFIGPRPLPLEYNQLYTKEQQKRLTVLPGITGLAQVKGRNSLSWEEKFAFDCEYVRSQTLRLDFKIVLLTIYKVAYQDGISQDSHVTMSKFTGLTPRKESLYETNTTSSPAYERE
ncbi:sugar transferase [Listeria ivanovii]|uniref:sugar transferase n=1 Tax=Listeria ivanovii TaxID=1638 RepID=UPI000DA73C94|nr:sugar transferase [Listeria ivanovii]PZF90513.1 sugar transferase [Listeria ivanovii]PZF95899.1 sugar transferase [Listeria ivanovii]PZG06149.1 sugar transferase [Listeria ivanovii]PZG11068.1 sugar transferase [Listeria ivanovii]PZG28037.1 sugar transferase [Listeria ivanovii]